MLTQSTLKMGKMLDKCKAKCSRKSRIEINNLYIAGSSVFPSAVPVKLTFASTPPFTPIACFLSVMPISQYFVKQWFFVQNNGRMFICYVW